MNKSEKRMMGVPIFFGVVTTLLMAATLMAALYMVFPPTSVRPDGRDDVMMLGFGLDATKYWLLSYIPMMGGGWEEEVQYLNQHGWTHAVEIRGQLVVVISGVLGFLVMMVLTPFQDTFRPGMRQERGFVGPKEGHAGVKAAAGWFDTRYTSWNNGRGLYLAPGVQMDLKTETEGWLILGAPGSGKTQFFRFLIDQILARSRDSLEKLRAGVDKDDLVTYPDKIITTCFKTDVTETWPSHDMMLMAPHDTGIRVIDGKEVHIGVAWDFFTDIRGKAACQDFAAAIVPATNEPVWGDAARCIVAGMLFSLQSECLEDNDRWYGWKDLFNVVKMTAKEIKDYVSQYDAQSVDMFIQLAKNGDPTRTAMSYLANIRTRLYPLFESLAAGWGEYPRDRHISIKEWLTTIDHPIPALILQKNDELEELSNAWMRAFIRRSIKLLGTDAFDDNHRRRIWYILDEYPQIAQEGDGILKLYEIGRSKGICPVIGAQVSTQFDKPWSEAERDSLDAMVKNRLIFRTMPGKAAKMLAEDVLGSTDWVKKDVSVNRGKETSRNHTERTENRYVILPEYLTTRLGETRRVIRFLYLTGQYGSAVGGYVCRLEIPFTTWKKMRKPCNLAPWVYNVGHSFYKQNQKKSSPAGGSTKGGASTTGANHGATGTPTAGGEGGGYVAPGARPFGEATLNQAAKEVASKGMLGQIAGIAAGPTLSAAGPHKQSGPAVAGQGGTVGGGAGDTGDEGEDDGEDDEG